MRLFEKVRRLNKTCKCGNITFKRPVLAAGLPCGIFNKTQADKKVYVQHYGSIACASFLKD